MFRFEQSPHRLPSILTMGDERASHVIESPAEASALWPLVAALAQIAERVERRRAEEHVTAEFA